MSKYKIEIISCDVPHLTANNYFIGVIHSDCYRKPFRGIVGDRTNTVGSSSGATVSVIPINKKDEITRGEHIAIAKYYWNN